MFQVVSLFIFLVCSRVRCLALPFCSHVPTNRKLVLCCHYLLWLSFYKQVHVSLDRLRQKMYCKVLNNLEYEGRKNSFLKKKIVSVTALHISSFPANGWDHVMLPYTPSQQKCSLNVFSGER